MISVLSAENADATEHVCWCPQRPSRFFMFSPLGMVGAVSENEKRHPTSMNHYQSGDSFPYHPVWVWLECNDPDHWTPRQDGRIHTYVFWVSCWTPAVLLSGSGRASCNGAAASCNVGVLVIRRLIRHIIRSSQWIFHKGMS